MGKNSPNLVTLAPNLCLSIRLARPFVLFKSRDKWILKKTVVAMIWNITQMQGR
jgi:hypothetical protein